MLVFFLAIAIIIIILYFRSNKKETYVGDPLKIYNYYASWCGISQEMMPEWDKFESMMKNTNVKVDKVQCDLDESFNCEHFIKGYPTIIAYKDGKEYEYQGERTAEAFKKFTNNVLQGKVSGIPERTPKSINYDARSEITQHAHDFFNEANDRGILQNTLK